LSLAHRDPFRLTDMRRMVPNPSVSRPAPADSRRCAAWVQAEGHARRGNACASDGAV